MKIPDYSFMPDLSCQFMCGETIIESFHLLRCILKIIK